MQRLPLFLRMLMRRARKGPSARYDVRWEPALPVPDLSRRVRKAVNHLAAHYREPFRLEELARLCGLSVSRLAHLFLLFSFSLTHVGFHLLFTDYYT